MLYKWLPALFMFLVPAVALSSGASSEPAAAHPFYVSVTEIRHDAATKNMEFSFKIFTDDFEKALEKYFKAPVDLTAAQHREAAEKYIREYIATHFSITVDGVPLQLSFIGFERERESVYSYFEAAGISSVQAITVRNNILYDYKQEQVNILHVTVNGKRQSHKLEYPKAEAAFRF
ncbi:MAG TPA: DUF6702 family protein [Flavisolibacter sp.]